MTSVKYSKSQLIIITLLLFSIIVQGVWSALHNSTVWDELFFIGEGKAIFSTGNIRRMVASDHPPLSYYINSIPLIPLKFDEKIWQNDKAWEIGKEVLFESSYDPKFILFISRIPFVLLSVILAFFILKWATELYGKKSGIVALLLYSFNPAIIGYSSLAVADFTVAMMIFIATYYFWRLIKKPSKKNLLLAGIFFGLAQLSKITAIMLYPLFIVIGAIAVYEKESNLKSKTLVKNLLVIFIIGFVLIWAFHMFQFGTIKGSLVPVYYSEKAREELSKIPIISDYLLFIYDKVPLPASTYVGMIGHIFYASTQDKTGFMLGEIVDNQVWYYGILTFIIKTNFSFLLMLILLLFLHKKLPKKDFITNASLILPIIFIFIIFSITSKTSGINHILTIYPFLSVLASNIVNAPANIKGKNIFNAAIPILLISYAVSTILIAPYYLSYINILGGGPNNAYKIVVGSNIDQGQDLFGLKKFMEKNKIDKIKLSYWGSIDPRYYGISYEYLPSPYFQPWQNNYTSVVISPPNVSEDCSKRKGLIAISITNLQNAHLLNRTCYNWLKKYEPIEKIGYSIFVYNIE